MSDFELEMKVGDTQPFRFVATWPADAPEYGALEGDPYPLNTAQKVWFTAKSYVGQSDDDAPIRKSSEAAGDDAIAVDENVGTGRIVEADLEEFLAIATSRWLYAEVQVKHASGEVWTVAEGRIRLKPQVQISSL
jgi:hypothetical protein